MKNGQSYIFLIFFWLFALAVKAQWDVPIAQYWQTKTAYNPSFVGENNAIDLMALYRFQSVGAMSESKVSFLSVNTPFNFLGVKHGVGIAYTNEKIKSSTNKCFAFQYAYKYDISEGRLLNFGVQYSKMKIEYDAEKVHSSSDTLTFLTGKKTIPDISLGISLITDSYYIGGSISHVFEPRFKFVSEDDVNKEEIRNKIGRTYHLVGGYNVPIQFSPIVFKPSFLLKSDNIETTIDLTARVEYSKLLAAGVSWRNRRSWGFLLSVKLFGIESGYAYELPYNDKFSKMSSCSHEFVVRYDISLLQKRKAVGRYKSIRIL